MNTLSRAAKFLPTGDRQGEDGAASLRPAQLLAYGALGLPLAVAALPIYVHLPRLYGEFIAVPLAALGLALLAARVLDAVTDPLIGAATDRAHQYAGGRFAVLLTGTPLFAVGLWLLLTPPPDAGLPWLLVTLTLATLGYSVLNIAYQRLGAELGRDDGERRRLTTAREAFVLLGVMLAATLPSVLAEDLPTGLQRLTWVIAPVLALALWLNARQMSEVSRRATPSTSPHRMHLLQSLRTTWADDAFRTLLNRFIISGIASALPATLVLFYISDVLNAEALSGALLAAYFGAGLLGLPFWASWAKYRGTSAAWRDGLVIACVAFAITPFLGGGHVGLFTAVCVLTGFALGADLVLPAAALAQHTATRHPDAIGAYFGVWNLFTKLNLALAAGISLPLLAAFGYIPGEITEGDKPWALAILYGALPLVGKLWVAVLLWIKPLSISEQTS